MTRPDSDDATAPAEREWPVKVTLKHPVDFGKDRIEQLEFRSGKLADLKGMKLDGIPPVDDLLMIASRMCGRPRAALEMLQAEDGGEVMAIALDFFARCLGAGKTG